MPTAFATLLALDSWSPVSIITRNLPLFRNHAITSETPGRGSSSKWNNVTWMKFKLVSWCKTRFKSKGCCSSFLWHSSYVSPSNSLEQSKLLSSHIVNTHPTIHIHRETEGRNKQSTAPTPRCVSVNKLNKSAGSIIKSRGKRLRMRGKKSRQSCLWKTLCREKYNFTTKN